MSLYGTYDADRMASEFLGLANVFCDGDIVKNCVEFNQCDGWAIGEPELVCEPLIIGGVSYWETYGVSGRITVEVKE